MASTTTVGKYLTKRLEQAGLKHIFGVPGDYVLDFFDLLEESSMQVIGTCNELNAGYAADAYARLHGIGGLCVTYGVGGFSAYNAIAGAFAERLPVVLISGGPRLTERSDRHLLHHTIGSMNLQHRVFEPITAAAVILKKPEQAPQQIDATLGAGLRRRRPVYIEIPMDLVAQPCIEPGPFEIDTTIPTDLGALAEAVAEAVTLLTAAQNPIILAGIEVHRLRIQDALVALINHSGYAVASTLLAKSVIPESHPQFIGVYKGYLGRETVQRRVEDADLILCLGTLMTDVNLGHGTALVLDIPKMIVANSDKVRIKHHVYDQVSLRDFMVGLTANLPQRAAAPMISAYAEKGGVEKFVPVRDQEITHKRFYQRLQHFLDLNSLLVVDTGDSIFAAADLLLPGKVPCINQSFYMSIGFSVPATLGAKLAAPERRPVTIVGDGAFQMTAQELSTMIRHRQNPVIFLINNDGYTIERALHEGPYNDLHMWQYHRLTEVFNGGWGCQVTTEGELEDALQKAQAEPDTLAFIEVRLDRLDCSEGILRLGQIFKGHTAQK
ncbi:MAG: thiamine pyrophosphate-binding protein [Desulfobacca sp.]|nr:thiamine pyrophosphate-binding protein [Desulfobacca sp.]